MIRMLTCLALATGALFVWPGQAEAAESYDNCTGFIDTVPTTISTQGTWCLRHNLSTAITSGEAITVAANNVTIDCNDFKLGGLAAGNGSTTQGIAAVNRQNIIVRNCAIRGFYIGVNFLDGGAGHLVEDNRLDNNLFVGIAVDGDNNLVRGNQVHDTGGATGLTTTLAMVVTGDVVDNTVSGVFGGPSLYGIRAFGEGNEIRGNRVRNIAHTETEDVSYIEVRSTAMTVEGNRLFSTNPRTPLRRALAIHPLAEGTACLDNTSAGFYAGVGPGCDVTHDNHDVW